MKISKKRIARSWLAKQINSFRLTNRGKRPILKQSELTSEVCVLDGYRFLFHFPKYVICGMIENKSPDYYDVIVYACDALAVAELEEIPLKDLLIK